MLALQHVAPTCKPQSLQRYDACHEHSQIQLQPMHVLGCHVLQAEVMLDESMRRAMLVAHGLIWSHVLITQHKGRNGLMRIMC